MSKMFWKPIIDDVQNTGCNDNEIEALLDGFCYAMQYTACTLARKAEFHLEDFASSKQKGISDFTLTLEKYPNTDTEQWTGIFSAEGKKLEVFGSLEKGK